LYQTPRRNNPEDSYLHSRRHENLKSHLLDYHVHKNPLMEHILSRMNQVRILILRGRRHPRIHV
jgi:hypothetical protein